MYWLIRRKCFPMIQRTCYASPSRGVFAFSNHFGKIKWLECFLLTVHVLNNLSRFFNNENQKKPFYKLCHFRRSTGQMSLRSLSLCIALCIIQYLLWFSIVFCLHSNIDIDSVDISQISNATRRLYGLTLFDLVLFNNLAFNILSVIDF